LLLLLPSGVQRITPTSGVIQHTVDLAAAALNAINHMHVRSSHLARRERLYDPLTGLLRPNNFQDLGEALVSQGLPAALALVRDAEG
jgi:hypothetical protein